MEWVETTGRTVEDAVSRALDQLGIAADDAELEVLEEPRAGLFGRVRGSARVRARVRPTAPRPKQERRRRGTRRDGDGGSAPAPSERDAGREKPAGRADRRPAPRGGDDGPGPRSAGQTNRRPRREDAPAATEAAAPSQDKEREMMPEAEQRQAGEEFLAGLLQHMELQGSIDSSLDDAGVLRFEVGGEGLGLLIGPGLNTLEAVQEICRNAIQRQAAGREYGKVELDVAGARADRTRALEEFTRAEASKVLETGDEVVFDVMSRADRKVVHDVIGEFEGLRTESVGEDPRRRVVLRRA